jgi:hypothetical protein
MNKNAIFTASSLHDSDASLYKGIVRPIIYCDQVLNLKSKTLGGVGGES